MSKIFETVVLPVAALVLCILLAGTAGFYKKKNQELEAKLSTERAETSLPPSAAVNAHLRKVTLLELRNKCLEQAKALFPDTTTGSVLDKATAINRVCPVVVE